MEVGYDKSALQEYMDQVVTVREQMRLRQDECLNAFNSCKQQYNRIYTKLEAIAYRAYNQIENAESMQRSAELEYEAAYKIAENAEDDEKNAALQRMRQAQVMRVKADEEYSKACVAYSKASDDLKNLVELWDGKVSTFESQVRCVEEGMASFSQLVANGNSDLGVYMSIMDKGKSTLYGGLIGEKYGSATGISSFGNVTDFTGRQDAGKSDYVQRIGDSSYQSEFGNIVESIGAVNSAKTISINIGGKMHIFPATKSGIAKAYRSAVKSGDAELASYTKRIFFNAGASNGVNIEAANGHVSEDLTNIRGLSSSDVANNNKIAVAMVVNGLTRQADFGKLDNKTAQDIYNSVSETLNMFPDINLCFVGSVQARNKCIEESLREMYLNAYRQHYPTASDADLLPFVQQQVSEDMRGVEPGNGTIAQSLFIKKPQTYGEKIIAKYNGISINEHYGGDYNYFINVRRSDVEAKWKPVGCDIPRATVDHELGHQIAKLTNAHNDYKIQEMYSQFMSLNSTQRGEALSEYAGESIHEFIAEGWSEYRNNPNCRSLAMSIAKRLFDLYNYPYHVS